MITSLLRIILFLSAVLISLWILIKIGKEKAKVQDSLFWILFSFILIILSVFPQIAYWLSDKLGVQSPVNFIFLAVLFVLIVQIFRLSILISKLESRQQDLIQRYAIDHVAHDSAQKKECDGAEKQNPPDRSVS